jgi:hypothetical protein
MRTFYLGIKGMTHFDIKSVISFLNQLPNEST